MLRLAGWVAITGATSRSLTETVTTVLAVLPTALLRSTRYCVPLSAVLVAAVT
jgi:hypothetical protein